MGVEVGVGAGAWGLMMGSLPGTRLRARKMTVFSLTVKIVVWKKTRNLAAPGFTLIVSALSTAVVGLLLTGRGGGGAALALAAVVASAMMMIKWREVVTMCNSNSNSSSLC